MSETLAYFNGKLLPQSQARLPLHDAGFVMGATVTDLCRTVHHRLYRLPDHIERFQQSCQLAKIRQLLSDEELTKIAEELTANNAKSIRPELDLALVLFATPGPVSHYAGLPAGPGEGSPTLGMHTFPLPFARYAPFFRQGASLVVPNVLHVPAQTIDRRIKHRSRLFWWLADREVQELEPGSTALLLDAEGHVTETAAANFLIVQDGKVISPPHDSILGGISLKVVQEICRRIGIPFQEKPLSLDDCLRSDEAMITSTPFWVAGVSRINGRPIPWPGKIFRRILAECSTEAKLDIESQITAEY